MFRTRGVGFYTIALASPCGGNPSTARLVRKPSPEGLAYPWWDSMSPYLEAVGTIPSSARSSLQTAEKPFACPACSKEDFDLVGRGSAVAMGEWRRRA